MVGSQQLRRKNIRLAWILAGVVMFFFLTSFPFWQGFFRMVVDQAP